MELITNREERLRLFDAYEADAFHLELRDSYGSALEDEAFQQWKAGEPIEDPMFDEWLDRIRRLTKTGKTVRRVRVVTEPISEYVRFEWEETAKNIAAGEDIRWLPRNRIPDDVAFPADGKDWWLFDGRLVVFGHLDDAGDSIGWEIARDVAVVEECVQTRDRLWLIAIPHGDYRPQLP